MQIQDSFNLTRADLQCTNCQKPFAAEVIAFVPPVNETTPVEADLHRVINDPKIRQKLFSTCPNCHHTWWSTHFGSANVNANILPMEYDFDVNKTFTQAMLSGRKMQVHSLDLALVAMNAVWSLRESGQSILADKWLELAAVEFEKALSDRKHTNWNRGYYTYILAEVYRQRALFRQAVLNFDKVDPRANIPKELVGRQKVQAIAGESSPCRIPKHLVKWLYVMDQIKRDDQPALEEDYGFEV